MKVIFKKLLFLTLLVGFLACDDDLEVVNPNDPTLDVLDTEEGLQRSMLGIYNTFGTGWYPWIVHAYHEVMGDAMYIPWGNWGFRWANQPTSITLDDGTVVTPPQGGTQGEQLQLFNDRAQGTGNAFSHEWREMYSLNNIGNLLLEKLAGGTIELAGDATTKTATVEAYAHFWKGFAYSRVGSMYAAGIITDEFGGNNPSFVSNTELLTEANAQLDAAIEALNRIDNLEPYESFLSAAIPDYMRPDGILSPDEFIRMINTQKARNILANTRLEDMTPAQWEEVRSLAAAGLQPGDNKLELRTADENAAFGTSIFVSYRILTVWHFPSERLVQDFKEGDARFDRNFITRADVQVNRAGRGIQYGTRWALVPIDDGGDYATLTASLDDFAVAGTWEEAALMEAEALIMTGSIEEGLAIIDEVRTAQEAALPAVAGTGLSMEEAYEELRLERRIGLYMRGLAFYDARRWGVNDPVSEGGGRTGAVVLDAEGNLNTNATFNYNYLSYWGVPDQELDFNEPAEGSASVAPF
ncbi:MAG: RagB/SusD family nutrient uptake outer membrane protein [Bacteroidota bacterium]